MSEKYLKVGQRVEIINKDVRGVIAYVGVAAFAVGKWVGVVLDDPKGKNNGSIKGTVYFQCEENHGMFVRPTQLIYLDENNRPIEDLSSSIEEKSRSRLSSTTSVRSLNTSVTGQPITTKPTAVRRKSPVKQLTKRTTMTPSTSSSRLSLSGSRQSLTGSRTQLVSPAGERSPSGIPTTASLTTSVTLAAAATPTNLEKSEKPKKSISPPHSLLSSKGSSFIETGFVETLKPHFTPGFNQSMQSPAMSAEEKLHMLQLQNEIDEQKKQFIDLSEKFETLKQRRSEDKERLREFDKMKTQYEQLLEFKTKIMEAQSQLQRDLQRAKQEAKDAIEARDIHNEEMSELSENVEMITLDKEMAEEKAETLQLELDTARERIEELTLDLEIMKAEMQEKSGIAGTTGAGDTNTSTMSTYEFKQLEQQNVRLRETLVRMRDYSANEKHELQKTQKELDTKKSEVAELQRTKEKLSSKVDELEGQVVDLQEQVDAALGAEEMVEQLADKKMELEDKVKLLEQEVAELEDLEEVHAQLVESNHELELDMREELDMANAAKREATREKEAALETIIDRDQTILKFRELVNKLNEQTQELREKLNQDTGKPGNKETILAEPSIDFKQMFNESKAFTRAIDLQLRQIELKQSSEHIQYLTAYMPETFMARGGDHDAILVILLISRLVFKSGIIVSQARERFPAVPSMDRTAIFQGHAVHQFSFRSRLLHHVHNLQNIMHQFLFGLSTCTPEALLKIGASIPEMIAQEKVVDGFVELLKNNQLDENSSTDNLEKCASFFNAMYSVLLANEDLINEVQIVRDGNAAILAACDAINTDASIIQAIIKDGDETSDSGLLMQYIIQNSESIKQQLKLIKRRLPQDISISKCKLSMKTLQNLKITAENLNKIMNVLFLVSKQVLHIINVENDGESEADQSKNISHVKLWELLSLICEKIYEQDDRGPSQNIRTILSTTNTDMSQLAQYLLDNEYEIMGAGNQQQKDEKKIAPIVLRAQFVKKQLEETKTLTATLENREAEIRQLKLAAKAKQDELSEMQIRKDLAEKKLSVLQQDHESNTIKLQRQYDEVVQQLKKKEKEFEETMDHLQNDIDSLESEKSALREKVKVYSTKKGSDLKTTTALDITAGSPYIVQELSLLKKALTDERAQRLQLQASEYKKILSRLEPIHIPKPKDNRIDELEKKLSKVKFDYVMSLVKGAEIPQSKTVHANIPKLLRDHDNRQRKIRQDIQHKVESIASEIMEEYLDRKPHRATKGDFSHFPTIETTRALKSN